MNRKFFLSVASVFLFSALALSSQGLKTGAPGATAPKTGESVAVLDTNFGRIIFKFFPKSAPKTVENFKKLAKSKFYNGTTFHRVIDTFMIQGGDPNTKPGATGVPGTGGPGYTIKDEFSSIHHNRGIVAMAHTGMPNSAGSQFYIMVVNLQVPNQLDGQYAVFGQVVTGMDVVDKIKALPRDGNDMPTPKSAVMKKVWITSWPVK